MDKSGIKPTDKRRWSYIYRKGRRKLAESVASLIGKQHPDSFGHRGRIHIHGGACRWEIGNIKRGGAKSAQYGQNHSS